MQGFKRPFTRESADFRRDALIAACGQCLARHGALGTSVRAICTEAKVSPGLLRHYFEGIDALIAATYRATGARVAGALKCAVEAAGVDPRARLLAFVSANFRAPITDPELLATWLAFWSLSRTDVKIGEIHDEIYAGNRRDIEELIAACATPADLRLAAVGLSALIDGLWLELSLGGAPFSAQEAEGLAEQWVATLLGREQHRR
jgi:TetR/AcrR family transcriptional regulator, transcriptional repressor of bet genes